MPTVKLDRTCGWYLVRSVQGIVKKGGAIKAGGVGAEAVWRGGVT